MMFIIDCYVTKHPFFLSGRTLTAISQLLKVLRCWIPEVVGKSIPGQFRELHAAFPVPSSHWASQASLTATHKHLSPHSYLPDFVQEKEPRSHDVSMLVFHSDLSPHVCRGACAMYWLAQKFWFSPRWKA